MNENIIEISCVKITKDHKLVIDMDDFDDIRTIFICDSGIEIIDIDGDMHNIYRNQNSKDFYVKKTVKDYIG